MLSENYSRKQGILNLSKLEQVALEFNSLQRKLLRNYHQERPCKTFIEKNIQKFLDNKKYQRDAT